MDLTRINSSADLELQLTENTHNIPFLLSIVDKDPIDIQNPDCSDEKVISCHFFGQPAVSSYSVRPEALKSPLATAGNSGVECGRQS